MISKIDINRIAEATDIVDLISQEVSLKRQGSGLVGCCPFHQEKTGSFHVSEARQTYHCFGCHKHGDVFSWVMERDGLTFYEAVRKLAKRANIELKERERTAEEIAAETKREAMLMTTDKVKQRTEAMAEAEKKDKRHVSRGTPRNPARPVDVRTKGGEWDTFPSVHRAAIAIGCTPASLNIALKRGKTEYCGCEVRFHEEESELDKCLREIEERNRKPYEPSRPIL